MKKGLFIALLSILGFAANAQDIVNNTMCAITITPVCYNPVTCLYITCGSTVTVAAGSTAVIPGCACPVSSNLQGYRICWLSPITTCGCATLGKCGMNSYPCPDFQPTARLNNCDNCTDHIGANISCTSSGDIIVQ